MKEPKIRLKGFTGEWETAPLDKCVDFLDNLRKPIDEGSRINGIYPYYGASGIVDFINDYIFDEELILLSEDGANITDRNYPVCFLASGKYWVNNHAHVLRVKEGFVNNFVCNAMERKDYSLYNTGMAMPKLNKEVCKRIPLSYPVKDEQGAIAKYFQNLDSLIQSTTKKIDSLKQVKAASLQSMFPQEGETTPRVRFKGFEGEWEKKELAYIAYIQKGEQVNKSALTDSGAYYVLNGGMLPSGYIDTYNTSANTISISEGGNSCGYVCYNKENFWSGGHNYTLQDVKLNSYYLYSYLKGIEVFIMSKRVGSGLPNIQKKSLAEILVYYPSNPVEQERIANFFLNLDEQISQYKLQLENLQQIKSACLDNMFV